MYSVSEEFYSAMENEKKYIRILNQSGEELIPYDEVKSAVYEAGCCSGKIGIGNVSAAHVTIEISGKYDLLNQVIIVQVGAVSDDVINYVPLGVFAVTKCDSTDFATSIEGYDPAYYLLNETYVPTVGAGASVYDVVSDICSQCGIPVDSDSISQFSGVYISGNLSGYTCREMLGYMAGKCCRNAIITRDGRLRFVWFSESGEEITSDDYYAGQYKDGGMCEVSGIVCYSGKNGETKYVSGSENNAIEINNPFVSESELNSIWSDVKETLDQLDYSGKNIIVNTLAPDVTRLDTLPKLIGQGMSTAVNASRALSVAEHGFRDRITAPVSPFVLFGTTSAANASLMGLVPEQTYTLSFDASWQLYSGTISATSTFYFRAYLYTDKAETGVFAQTSYATVGTIDQSARGTEMSGRCEFTFTIPGNATIAYILIAGNNRTASYYDSGDYIELRNIKLEKGNRATDWTSAPQDKTSCNYKIADITRFFGFFAEPGDVVHITNLKKDMASILVMGTSLSLDGGCKSTIHSYGESAEDGMYDFKSPTQMALEALQTDVANAQTAADKAIVGVEIQYASGASDETPPETGWSAGAPEPAEGYYIWQRTITTLADGSVSYSDALCIKGLKGDDGTPVTLYELEPSTSMLLYDPNAEAGSRLNTRTIEFWGYKRVGNAPRALVSDPGYISATANYNGMTLIASDSDYASWLRFTFPETADGQNLTAIYADLHVNGNTVATCTIRVVANGENGERGEKGEAGDRGTDGRSVSAVTAQYYVSTSKEGLIGGAWSETMPTWEVGKYLWIRTRYDYENPESTSYTEPYCDSSWEAVNEIEIGGRNLVLDSGAEHEEEISGTASRMQAGYYHLGDYGRDLVNEGKPESLTLSFEAKSTRAGDKLTFNLRTNRAAEIGYSATTTELGTEYQRYVVTLNRREAAEGYTLTRLWGTKSAASADDDSVASIRNVKLEKGNRATDWTPAPEDAASELEAFRLSVDRATSDLQAQLDDSVTTWFYGYAPTAANVPAQDWTTEEQRDYHSGDMFFDTSTGYCYRWRRNADTYGWQRIKDSDITSAMTAASAAQDTADGKRRVFYATPAPPYDRGDLWVQGEEGDIMRCRTDRTSGVYSAGDWVLASKYTDDTAANAAQSDIDNLQIGGRNLVLDSGAEISAEKTATAAKMAAYRSLSDYGREKLGETGTRYAVSFEAKASAEGLRLRPDIRGTASGTIAASGTAVELTTDWARYTQTGSISREGAARFWPVILSGDATGTVYIRNAKVELGNRATDWTPAPEDTAAAIAAANQAAEAMAAAISGINADIVDIQAQLDGEITAWYLHGTPTLTNAPAEDWTDTALREQHQGDTYTDLDTGRSYRFVNDGGWGWYEIADTDTAAALAMAQEAKDTADGKRRVFIDTPTPPYDQGDLWVQGSGGDILRCQTARDSGSYAAADWVLASKYTDDSAALAAQADIDGLQIGGRNLLAMSAANLPRSSRGITATDEGGGWIRISGTVTGTSSGLMTIWGSAAVTNRLLEAGTYTLSCEDEGVLQGTSVRVQTLTHRTADGGSTTQYLSEGQASITFTAEDHISRVSIYLAAGATGTELDGRIRLKLEKGNRATDWTPAPEDTDEKINAVKQSLEEFAEGFDADLAVLRTQTDRKAETWYQAADPSSAWGTDALKTEHIGDLWYNPSAGSQRYYRWSGAAWSELTAAPPDEVFDEIDGKAQIFVSTPTTPYSAGDLWFDSSTADIMTCVRSRSTGAFAGGDWEKRNKYTDDTAAGEAMQNAEAAQGAAENAQSTADAARDTAEWAQEHVNDLETWQTGMDGWKTTVDQKITDDAIISTVTASDPWTTMQSSVTQNAEGLTSKVERNGVISAINQSAESVSINAEKINLSGYVTVSRMNNALDGYVTETDLSTAGSTIINGGNITTGTINASLITTGKMSMERIAVYDGFEVYSGLNTSRMIGEMTWNNTLVSMKNANSGEVYASQTATGMKNSSLEVQLSAAAGFNYIRLGELIGTIPAVKTLWTNASPGAAFAAQSVSVSGLSGYDLVLIEFTTWSSAYRFTEIVSYASGRSVQANAMTFNSSTLKPYAVMRTATLYASSVTFGGGYYSYMNDTATAQAGNSYCVPTRITGVRF